MSLRYAPLTIALLIANVGIFFLDQLTPVHQPEGVHLLMWGGAIVPDKVHAGEWYRIITAGFLHFGWMHILFNMYALTQAGMLVENLYGSAKFFAIYMISLISGGVAAYVFTLHQPEAITAGASGAIMGLFGATFALGIKTPRLRSTLVGWALFPIIATLSVGFTTPGISNEGHIGGVIAGAIVAFILPARDLRTVVAGDDDDITG